MLGMMNNKGKISLTSNELIFRVLCDVRAKTTVDGAVLFSQTKDNQKSVFLAAKKILDKKLAKKILFINSEPICGYPGFSAWTKELNKLGIQCNDMVGVQLIKTNSFNTLIESQAIVNYAAQKKYRSLYVVASPFHQLRAFMTMVTVALSNYPDLLIFSYTGISLPWLAKVAHSQGTLLGTRKDIIKAELERIEKYRCKGDLSSETEIIEYLNRRDRTLLQQTFSGSFNILPLQGKASKRSHGSN